MLPFNKCSEHLANEDAIVYQLREGVLRIMVLVVNVFVFLKLSYFALLLLYVT